MKFKLLCALALVLVIAALYGWWRLDLRWRPETIDKRVAEITKLVEQSGWVSPGLGGPKLYMIGHRDCAACAAYKAQEFPRLHEASVDTRLIEIARADDKGAAQSTLAERSTVAELWVNRSWSLSQRWDAAAPGAWKAEGITPADTDVARGAVVEAGRKMAADLAPLLKANGIGAGYPILIWWDKQGRMRGCVCDKPETYRYVRAELGAKSLSDMADLDAAYQAALSAGRLRADPAQAHALQALIRLNRDLEAAGEPRLFRKPRAQRGVYLYGPVGRGKSMLMDLFYETAPVERKRRVHFHVFMGEVHRLIGQWRKGDKAQRKAIFGETKGDDPIAPTAAVIASSARLLCFDEFQVSDIADAMILGRLFEALIAGGVTVVATSNRAPDALYHNGVNRQLFLPFIAMLDAHLEVVAVKGAIDYRLDRLRGAQVWLCPNDAPHQAKFEALWRDLLDGAAETGVTLEVLGRKTHLPRAAGGLVRGSFASLCGQALGPQDYLALAESAHTLFLEAIPVLDPSKRSEARRFVTLIDALYEARVKLIALADVEPEGLYPQGEGAFEFERCVSRLQEMRSAGYLSAAKD